MHNEAEDFVEAWELTDGLNVCTFHVSSPKNFRPPCILKQMT